MRTGGLSLVLVSCLLIGSAAAQEKSGQQKRADELFEEGRALMAQEKAAEACTKFEEAIQLDPEAPGTMLNLGLCNEKLRKFKTALYWFRKAQARAAETNLPDYEEAAKQHTRDLAKEVATVKIAFKTTAPEGTKVKIDGQDVAPADYLAAEVDPGTHTLVAGAPGHKIFTQEFTVEGRGGQTLTIDLVEGDNSIVVDRGAGRRKIAIITAAGGGALLLGSLAVSMYAKSKYSECAENGEPNDPSNRTGDCMGLDGQALADQANKYQELAAYWGTGLFVAGTVAVGVAAVVYFTAPAKERIDRTVFVPTIGPDQLGFAATGRF